nr:translation initiation factor IF-2-like [Equus asinus]
MPVLQTLDLVSQAGRASGPLGQNCSDRGQTSKRTDCGIKKRRRAGKTPHRLQRFFRGSAPANADGSRGLAAGPRPQPAVGPADLRRGGTRSSVLNQPPADAPFAAAASRTGSSASSRASQPARAPSAHARHSCSVAGARETETNPSLNRDRRRQTDDGLRIDALQQATLTGNNPPSPDPPGSPRLPIRRQRARTPRHSGKNFPRKIKSPAWTGREREAAARTAQHRRLHAGLLHRADHSARPRSCRGARPSDKPDRHPHTAAHTCLHSSPAVTEAAPAVFSPHPFPPSSPREPGAALPPVPRPTAPRRPGPATRDRVRPASRGRGGTRRGGGTGPALPSPALAAPRSETPSRLRPNPLPWGAVSRRLWAEHPRATWRRTLAQEEAGQPSTPSVPASPVLLHIRAWDCGPGLGWRLGTRPFSPPAQTFASRSGFTFAFGTQTPRN